MASKAFSSLLFGLIPIITAQQCPIQFEGRVAPNTTLATFDTSASLFSPSFVFGQNLTWSKILQLPSLNSSLFDAANHTIPLEVTLSDDSIFAPSPTDLQTGFRRAELLPASNTGTDPSTSGVKTLHFSLMKDDARPLNYSHEYQLVFLETNDYSTNQFALKTGTIDGQPAGQNSNLLILQSNVAQLSTTKDLYTQDFTSDVWHNFGVVLDFNENTTQVYYSQDSDPLVAVTEAVSNDVSGQGQFHFGVLKKPTGEGITDPTTQGYQESGINESIIFGGIFEEDSTGGCVSLSL